jgi:hypothetical protein
MEGEVAVESTVGAGTAFAFTVPQAQVALHPEPALDAPGAPPLRRHSLAM